MADSADLQSAIDNYRWLFSPEGAKWLAEATALAAEPAASLVALAANLRRELPAERVHLLLEQIELRHRARDKFAAAERMFFTRLGLEQATDQWVAEYKATRFPPGQPLADLCCGIGGDLLALSRRGSVWAVDRNPIAMLLAEANAAATQDDGDCARNAIKFKLNDVAEVAPDLGGVAAWHIDPDRRPAGRRTTKVELHEPGPEVLVQLLAAYPNAAVKLAPAADLPEPWQRDAELEWISRGRQCRQLVAWFGDLAQHAGSRRATIIKSVAKNAPLSWNTFLGQPDVECETAPQIGRYVFEPDAAILAAKLEGALAAAHGLKQVTPGVAYFTADQPVKHKALDSFEVLGVLPYRTKTIRHWLSERWIGQLEVKKRGVPLDPEQVRHALVTARTGEEEATLLLARIGGHVTAILTKRLRAAI